MAAQPFNSIGGFSAGIPEVVVVNSAGNVVTNVLTSGNVQASTMYSGAYNHANGAPLTTGTGSIVLSKTSGQGLFVDADTPTFGWRDLLGAVTLEETGGPNRPSFTTYRNGIKQYQVDVGDNLWTEFHMTHDYAPGTDIFIHVHWSHISTGVTTGGVTWGFEMTYAKGYNQAAWPAPVTATIQQNASTTQYQHMIAEVQATGGGLLTAADLEPDGIILVRTFLSANDMSATTRPFIHYIDIHYQSTGMATKQKAPDFYT